MGLYISVTHADSQKKADHDNAYGRDDIYRVRAAYRGTDLLLVAVPVTQVGEAVTQALALFDVHSVGIDLATESYEIAKEQGIEQPDIGS